MRQEKKNSKIISHKKKLWQNLIIKNDLPKVKTRPNKWLSNFNLRSSKGNWIKKKKEEIHKNYESSQKYNIDLNIKFKKQELTNKIQYYVCDCVYDIDYLKQRDE